MDTAARAFGFRQEKKVEYSHRTVYVITVTSGQAEDVRHEWAISSVG